ncbi:hypothetical protein ACLKA7_016710 [Drosophila subpalustris]
MLVFRRFGVPVPVPMPCGSFVSLSAVMLPQFACRAAIRRTTTSTTMMTAEHVAQGTVHKYTVIRSRADFPRSDHAQFRQQLS